MVLQLFKILVAKPSHFIPLRGRGCGWENNIKIEIVEMGFENVNGVQVGHTGFEPFHYIGKFLGLVSNCHRLTEFPK